MEKFSRGQTPSNRPVQQRPTGSTQETFSDMASATVRKSGVVGKLLVVSLIVVSIAVTAFVGYAIINGVDDTEQQLVKADQYQAVFLTDGQIYFGKLADVNNDWVTLEQIYYLQVEQQVQPDRDKKDDEQPQQRISLAKLGNELHGPEDQMFIRRDNVLFWENLKDEGRVVQAINEYLNNQQNGGTNNTENTNDTGN